MDTKTPAILNWEKWPFKLVYFPMLFVWIYYIIRARAVWFFTSSNPTITFGGLSGETKKEMYSQLSPLLYSPTFTVQPAENYDDIIQKIRKLNINLPFVVKPEMGEAGILFRKIDHLQQLQEYHQVVTVDYMVQAMIHYPVEVSVFYYRMPNEAKGTITGFLHKVPMHVVGDGKLTLRQLIYRHPKAMAFRAEIERVHIANMDVVVPAGEKYVFSHAANHRRGARFYNLHNEIDDDLHAVFDKLSSDVQGWYYGRYDIMCQSINGLKHNQNFYILEYNGCGAEPNHIYDSGYTLGQAYREIMKHWKALYHISRYNARRGATVWPLVKGLRFLLAAHKQLQQMKKMEEQLSF